LEEKIMGRDSAVTDAEIRLTFENGFFFRGGGNEIQDYILKDT
jgi:hypothetical protein